jgi:hypothetical protein
MVCTSNYQEIPSLIHSDLEMSKECSKNKNIRDLYRGINEFKKDLKLATHLQLVPRSRKCGSILALPYTSSWRNA